MSYSEQIQKYRKIRKLYPNPKRASLVGHGDYCVGGACVLYTNGTNSIPLPETINQALIKLNPKVTSGYYGREIMENNDMENFNEAWDLVRKALVSGHN